MDAREAAGWAWMKASDRKLWLERALARLTTISNPAPGAAGQFTDPKLQAHVRKRQAEADEAAKRKRKESQT